MKSIPEMRRVVVGASWDGAELNLGDRIFHPLISKSAKTVVKLSSSRGCLYILILRKQVFGEDSVFLKVS